MPTPSKRGSPRWTRSPPYDDGARPEARGFFRTRTSRTSRDRWILTGGAWPLRREGPGAIPEGGSSGHGPPRGWTVGPPKRGPPREGSGLITIPVMPLCLSITHHPLLVGTSGFPDTARPRSRAAPGYSRSGVVTTARFATSRRQARTMVAVNRSPQASRDTALARSRVAGNIAAGRGPSRGKGVRAA